MHEEKLRASHFTHCGRRKIFTKLAVRQGENGEFFFISGDCQFSEHTKAHEVGHGSIQNWVFGPLTVFVCTIPGVVRFWYRQYLKCFKGKKESDLPPYESIWFERTATEWGLKFVDIMKKSEVL